MSGEGGAWALEDRVGRLEALLQFYSTLRASRGLDGLMSLTDKAKLDGLRTERLARVEAADLLNGAAIAAATWTDINANQSFTVGSAANWLAIEVRLGLVATAAAVTELAARLIFDSAGTPITVQCGNGIVGVAGGYGALGGALIYAPPGVFSAASHTVKLQLYAANACTAYCRPSTLPNLEWCVIRVVELAAP